MYIETSGWLAKGSTAWLLSPNYPPATRTGGKCLQFWYHMYGSSIGALNVYIRVGANNPSTATWSRSRDQGNQWLIGQISITTSYSYKVCHYSIALSITASKGSMYEGTEQYR